MSMFRSIYGSGKETWDGFMERFPILFADSKKSMKETCMCWGIECPIGWYHILDQLCTAIEFHNNEFARKYGIAVIADQVKEKFGTLRFYYSVRGIALLERENDPPIIVDQDCATEDSRRKIAIDYLEMLADNFIGEAEKMTYNTCADCGKPLDKDDRVETKGWISYVCKKCNGEREKRRAKELRDARAEAEEKAKKEKENPTT